MPVPTPIAIRDDNAISRLWWNYEIARNYDPDDIEGALSFILKTADIRSNLIERPWLASRRDLALAIFRLMKAGPWVTDRRRNFREFMISINRQGGGIVFEAMRPEEIDEFVENCVVSARAVLAVPTLSELRDA